MGQLRGVMLSVILKSGVRACAESCALFSRDRLAGDSCHALLYTVRIFSSCPHLLTAQLLMLQIVQEK